MRRLAFAALFVLAVFAAATGSVRNRRHAALARTGVDDGLLRAVVLGDSVARGAGDERGGGIATALDDHFRALGMCAAPVVNSGINGARTHHVRNLLAGARARAAVRTADVIVLSIGGNDLYGDSVAKLLAILIPNHRQQKTLNDVQGLVRMIRATNPAARIYLLGLYNPYRRTPLRAWLDRQINEWDARLIRRFAAAEDVVVVRIVDLLEREERISPLDHFHPGSSGYAAIASRIAASITKR